MTPDEPKVRRSQRDRILEAFRAGEELTFLSALQRFGCARLGARVHSLKAEGYPIVTRMIEVEKADGHRVTVACYRLAAAEPSVGPAAAAPSTEVA